MAEKPSQVLVLFSVGCWYTFIVDGDRQVLGRRKQPQHKGQAQENTEEQQEHYQDPRVYAPGLWMFLRFITPSIRLPSLVFHVNLHPAVAKAGYVSYATG